MYNTNLDGNWRNNIHVSVAQSPWSIQNPVFSGPFHDLIQTEFPRRRRQINHTNSYA